MTLLLILALVAGVVAALEAHRRWIAPRQMMPTAAGTQPKSQWFDDEANEPTSEPADIMGLAALAPPGSALTNDPMGVVAPAGAVRVSARAFDYRGYRYEQARYQFSGHIADAVGHYRQTLGEKGFSAIGDESPAGGGRTLIFVAKGESVTVMMVQKPGHADTVEIRVTVVRPAG